YIVATPIGNLEDLTYRAARVLGEVDCIAAEDTRAARVLLDRYGVRKPLVSYFEGNEADRTPALVERLGRGGQIALISEAGTPSVSDPGYRLVARAIEAGIPVVPLPGPSAALAALMASGLPTDRFLFVGFSPRAEGKRQAAFAALRQIPATLIF